MIHEWSLIFSDSARRDFQNLPKAKRRRVMAMINKLLRGEKEIKNNLRKQGEYYKLNTGLNTIVFAAHKPSRTICILRIFHQ